MPAASCTTYRRATLRSTFSSIATSTPTTRRPAPPGPRTGRTSTSASNSNAPGVSKRSAWLIAIAVLVLLGFFTQRPLRAWWDDDEGNRALLRGHDLRAARLFEAGLTAEPGWATLHEDLGRAVLPTDPARSLAEFDRAACGSPCLAQAGDALAAMGRTNEAIDRYVQAKAVGKVSQVAAQLVAAGRYDAALAVESALLAKLHNDF